MAFGIDDVLGMVVGEVVSGLGSSIFSGGGDTVDYTGMQNQIQWRVKDAEKAGVHPLYALGAPTVSPAVISSGSGYRPGEGAGQYLDYKLRKDEGSRSERLVEAQVAESKARASAATAQANKDQVDTMIAAWHLQDLRSKMNSQQDMTKAPTATELFTPLGSMSTSRTTDSQTVADQYGDLAGEIYGLWRLGNDGVEALVRQADRSGVPGFKAWVQENRDVLELIARPGYKYIRPGKPKPGYRYFSDDRVAP